MKKFVFSFMCLFVSACVSTTDFGTSVKGENIKKTTCYGGGAYDSIIYSKASCLNKAKEVCPMKVAASSTGRDFHGFFHEVLYICANENNEDK